MAMNRYRGYKPKKRNSHERRQKRIIVIAAEGNNKTEKLYFRNFSSDSVKVDFVPGGNTDPVNMANDLVDYCHDMDFDTSFGDKAYCLVDLDVDSNKNDQVKKADKIAAKNHDYNMEIIVSNPCFEEWFMCHFGFSTKQYCSSSELLRDVENKIPGYTKSRDDIYDLLYPRINDAIENAKKLEKFNSEAGRTIHTADFQPSTEVYKIVEMMKEICVGSMK